VAPSRDIGAREICVSHFTVGVILPDGLKPENDADAEKLIEPLLAPYDENITVEEYDKECGCKGTSAYQRACEVAEKEVGTMKSLREDFWKKNKDRWEDPFSKEADKEWAKHIAPYLAKKEEVLAADPEKDAFEKDCDDCKGTGTYKSTYNPKSKWDWYVVGGRWNNTLPNGKNISAVSELNGHETFALLVPDMGWLESARMGWWGMTSDALEESDWKKIVNDSYEAYKDNYLVLVDAHI
jgi:hypothetical protein